MDGLRAEDAAKWAKFPTSKTGAVRLTWFPRTKFIAAATFTPGGTFIGPNDAHGVGVTSSVGWQHPRHVPGVLGPPFINGGNETSSAEASIRWASESAVDRHSH